MAWTLWRAILIEFWRMLVLTTAVVVLAISFAVTIKPIAEGELSAAQALRFMGYAIPPMLAYALPFAACFASTMTYHRMVADNEILAAHASGCSHRKLLVPMLASGAVLGAILLTLNTSVIPKFLQRMEEMITRDFAKVMVNSLAQGRPAMIGDTEIHADLVERVRPEPGSPVEERFLLGGVVMVEATPSGEILIDGTARRAWIQLLPAWALPGPERARIGDDDATAIIMKFVDLTVNERGDAVRWESVVSPAIPIPRAFRDDPKFLTTPEMRELREHPGRMGFVDEHRVRLARAIAMDRAGAAMRDTIGRGGPIVLDRASGGRVRIDAGALRRDASGWAIEPPQGSDAIGIEIDAGEGAHDTLAADAARLDIVDERSADPFTLDTRATGLAMALELERVTIRSTTDTEMSGTRYTGLTLPSDPLESISDLSCARTLTLAREHQENDRMVKREKVGELADALEFQVAYLGREVLAKIHERWAISVTGLVVVVTGAVSALRLRHASPLTIYLWSFFPSLLVFLLIAGGEQTTHQLGAIGLPHLWLGVALIVLYTLSAFRKVSRF